MARPKRTPKVKMVVMGASVGGFKALRTIFSPLPADFPVPVLVVRHQAADTDDYVVEALNRDCQVHFKFAEEGEQPEAGTIYIAPPDHHLMVGNNGQLHLSKGVPVNYSRPSIDPLFISAAQHYKSTLLAVILTGSNGDGMDGLIEVKGMGGRIVVQDPESAESDVMPRMAMEQVEVDYLVWLDQIGAFLWGMDR